MEPEHQPQQTRGERAGIHVTWPMWERGHRRDRDSRSPLQAVGHSGPAAPTCVSDCARPWRSYGPQGRRFLFPVLRMEHRGTLPLSYVLALFIFILRWGLAQLPVLPLNLRSSCGRQEFLACGLERFRVRTSRSQGSWALGV